LLAHSKVEELQYPVEQKLSPATVHEIPTGI